MVWDTFMGLYTVRPSLQTHNIPPMMGRNPHAFAKSTANSFIMSAFEADLGSEVPRGKATLRLWSYEAEWPPRTNRITLTVLTRPGIGRFHILLSVSQSITPGIAGISMRYKAALEVVIRP